MFSLGLILIINIICLAFFQFISLQLAVVYRSSNVHARGKNAENLQYSAFFLKFHHFHFHFLCDTKKTRIIVLFFTERKKKVGTFQFALHTFVWAPGSVARPKLPFQHPFSHIVVFWKPSIKDNFPILQLDIWSSNKSNMHIFHSLDRALSVISVAEQFCTASG